MCIVSRIVDGAMKVPQKTKELPRDPAMPFLIVCPKEPKHDRREMSVHSGSQWHNSKPGGARNTKVPTMDEWIKKMWSIHTMEYYLAQKRKEVLSHAMTWINLENITVSEISQSEKDNYCMIPLTVVKFAGQKVEQGLPGMCALGEGEARQKEVV